MDFAKREIEEVARLIEEETETARIELEKSYLCALGGGFGEVIFG